MIHREEKDWGVKLTLEPLDNAEAMRLTGEIDDPKPGKRPVVRFWLDATPSQKPLSMTDLVVIQQGLHQFMDKIKDETAQMMNPKGKKSKKK